MTRNEAFNSINEADLTRAAERLRAETLAGWVRGLRRRVTGAAAR